ncbi:MAG TPA: zinc-binding dehydrogenase [Saprospiraceae bacterium]|nr:zinc-binding dehydrogenase [Saprospiraceae bacterium]
MQALVLNTLHQPLQLSELPDPQAQPGEGIVHLHAAALNHRDVYITQGKYAGIELPCVLGSDGAGEYEGRRVLIFPSLHWGDDPRAQGRHFRVLGMPDPGTFAEQIAVPLSHLYPVPEHLSWEEAAALPLGGLTAWRVLMTRCQLRPGERVLVSGIGGGVALFALQFAVAAGAEVWVTSSRPEKIERAVALGAKGGADYRAEGWDKVLKAAAGGFDVVIDAAGGEGFAAFAGLCNPGGRIGIYGGTAGRISGLSPQIVFWKQLSILGSSMGDAADFEQMLDFVGRHAIRPVVDAVFPLAEGNAALRRLDEGAQFGKVVLRIRGSRF